MRADRAGATGLLVFVAALLLCGPILSASTPTDRVNAAATTTLTSTVAANWDCNGAGLSASAVIADQIANVVFSYPSPAPVSTNFNLTADVGKLNLSAAPSFLDLNSAGVNATPTVTGGTAAAIPVTNFVGNGASLDLNPFTIVVNQAAGNRTVALTKIEIIVGSTGFICTPIGTAPSVTFPVGTTTTTTTSTTTSTTTTTTTTTTSTTTTTVKPTTTTTSTTTTTVPPTTTTTTVKPTTTTTSTTTTTVPPTTTTSTTVPPTTSTTTSTTSTTVPSTTTTVPPTTTTTPSGSVTILEARRTVNYGCRLVDPATGGPFGSGKAPDSSVTFVVKYPSKVGAGQTFQVSVRVDPAPKNGPIALNVGEVTYTVDMAANGATSPLLEFTGNNTAAIAPNALFSIPQDGSFLVGQVTAPATAGGTITMDMGKVDLLGDKGIKVLTACAPSPKAGESALKLASVAVVEEQVEVPVVTTTTTTTTVPAGSTSYSSCAEARADGRGVIPRTSPAYSPALDPNGNGLACDSTDGPQPTVEGAATTRSTTAAGGSGALAFTGLTSLRGAGVGLVVLLVGLALVAAATLRRRRDDSS